MADDQPYQPKSFSQVLGALGPGGIATVSFDDYHTMFGHGPTEDQIEGARAARFASDHGCSQAFDHANRHVHFTKK